MPGTFSCDPEKNIITVTGGTETSPVTCNDVWEADKAGTLTNQERTGISASDSNPVDFTYSLRPADEVLMGGEKKDFYLVVSNWKDLTEAKIRIFGTNEAGTEKTEDITITGNGTFYLSLFRTATKSQVISVTGSGSFDYKIEQGRWGVVWKEGNSYVFNTRITIGDRTTETWFADTNVNILFPKTAVSAMRHNTFDVKAKAHLRFGSLVDTEKKIGTAGVSIMREDNYNYGCIINGDRGSDVQIYASRLKGYSRSNWGPYLCLYGDVARVYQCVLQHIGVVCTPHLDIYDAVLIEGFYGFIYYRAGGSYSFLRVLRPWSAFVFSEAYAVDVKDVIVKDHDFIARVFKLYKDSHLVNTEADRWNFKWQTPYGPGKVYRDYTFDLKVTDKEGNPLEGAKVSLFDKDGNQVFQEVTDADGKITTQTVTYGWYVGETGDTLNCLSPHTLKIKKTGWKTYKKKFNLDEKINWRIALKRPSLSLTEAVRFEK